MRPPGAVRILDTHVEHPSVTVDVLDLQTVVRLLARVRSHARPNEAALLEPALGSVRVQARDDVEDARVEDLRNLLVLSVPGEKPVDQVECGRTAGPLHRVDVRL